MKKKMELSEYLNGNVVLERYHCFNKGLEELYNNALSNGIILQYNKKDLMQYIKEQKKSLLEIPIGEEFDKQFKKKNNRLLIKKALFRTLFFLSLYSFHVAGKNFQTQEASNVINSILMINNLSKDLNEDGILEIDTSILNYINKYCDPGDDKYFYNSNFIYRLSDYIKISDSVSFDVALNQLGYGLIEIDGIIYSRTGNITKIMYDINGEEHIDYTDVVFRSNEEVKKYLSNIYDYDVNDILNVTISFNKTKSLEEIPTIKKSKEDGTVIVEEPSNNIKHSLIKKLRKEG